MSAKLLCCRRDDRWGYLPAGLFPKEQHDFLSGVYGASTAGIV
jgi:hypothetical protein